ELDGRANHLAHDLRALGVGPDVAVGLCVNGSPEMIMGALAILKAGGAYLPLDPAQPAERLAFSLNDARCPLAAPVPSLAAPRSPRWDSTPPSGSSGPTSPRGRASTLPTRPGGTTPRHSGTGSSRRRSRSPSYRPRWPSA